MDKAQTGLLLAMLPALLATGWTAPARAEEITILGMARSVSLMRQLVESCADRLDLDREIAGRYQAAFTEAGEKAYGKQKFTAELKKETPRRAREARQAGADTWCPAQRESLLKMGGEALFRK